MVCMAWYVMLDCLTAVCSAAQLWYIVPGCQQNCQRNLFTMQARIALRFPWWTLKSSFAEIQQLAQLDGDAQQVQSSLDMQSSISKEGIPPGMAASRSPNQICMDEADFLLNTVAACEQDWDTVRDPLADKYAGAGLSAVADFVRAGRA